MMFQPMWNFEQPIAAGDDEMPDEKQLETQRSLLSNNNESH